MVEVFGILQLSIGSKSILTELESMLRVLEVMVQFFGIFDVELLVEMIEENMDRNKGKKPGTVQIWRCKTK